MLMFTLAISCLTTSHLPWFMDLTFQVPMQYCSSQHQTLLPSPVTSTFRCCFCFVFVFSFFLDLFLHSFPVAYWAIYQPGELIFQCPIFLPFHTMYTYNWWASLVAQRLKCLPAMWETWVRSLGWEDPLEKEMATHSSILAWKIPWTEEPGGLQSMGLQRVRHDWSTSLH